MTPRRRTHQPRIRAVAYCRVSSEQQADSELSLDHQQDKCRALATVHDYDLIDVIVDAGHSAKNLKRPGMTHLLELVEGRHVEAILIAKLDRITRRVTDLGFLLDLFKQHHVALVSASDSLNTETAAGRMFINIMASIAEWERDTTIERTIAALDVKRQRGERISKDAPYGWSFTTPAPAQPDAKAPPALLVSDPIEQERLRFMLEYRTATVQRRNKTLTVTRSYQKIAAELNRRGWYTRSGRRWRWEYIRNALTRHAASTHAD